jgi:hypothetical protein
MRHKAILRVNCTEHPQGHVVTMLSAPTDDAWWMADLFGMLLAKEKFFSTVSYWHKEHQWDEWEKTEPPDFSARGH